MRYVPNRQSQSFLSAPRRRFSRCELTRALAGTPSGARGLYSSSRGSVLILVLGTLALMTVLAVVYVGIGRGDRQTARAVVNQKKNQEIPQQIADYLAGVIAEDMLATAPSYESVTGGSATTAYRREAWDAPFSDPAYRSNPAIDEQITTDNWVNDLESGISDDVRRELLRFRPSGTHPFLLDDASILGQGVVNTIRGNIDFDRRVGSDPWLASSEPVNLDLHLGEGEWDDQFLEDPGIPDHPTQVYSEAQTAWFRNRDILQMSDFAPDGRAVNLFNLRNNFGARSDIGSVPGSISSSLTLFGAASKFPPYLFTDPQFLWDSQTEADFNRPDHWFTNQRAAFRAMSDPDRGWAAPEFLFYQYADADGDGMVDSRWIELVDATDPDNPVSLLADDGRFRYFIAAHAEDLSGRVNVNVAKSGAVPGTKDEPAGFTPADVDLARVLNLEEAWTDTLWGYTGLEMPRLENGGIDLQSPENYAGYDPFNNNTGALLLEHVGQAGYDSIQFARLLGVVPPQSVVMDLTEFNDSLYRFAVDEFGLGVLAQFQDGRERLIPSSPRSWRHSAFGRAHGFALDALRSAPATDFGLDSLDELLTYNGVNDSDVTSNLESALGGRYDGDNSDFEGFPTLNLDPFRSNRLLLTERGDHDAFDSLYTTDIGGGGASNGTPDGITDADAMILAATDIRRRTTTHSWAMPMYSAVVERPWVALDDWREIRHLTETQANDLQRAASLDSSIDPLPAFSELRTHINANTILERGSWDVGDSNYFDVTTTVPLLDNPKAVFELYADALLPYSGVPGSWPTGGIGGGAGAFSADTLQYGYRGAELALRTSAHMALNLIDAMDDDDVPTQATLLIDEQAYQTLNSDEERQPNGRTNDWAVWASAPDTEDTERRIVGLKLDLNRDRNGDGERAGNADPTDPEARLANSGRRSGELPQAAAINVFGIEAQPFITEVSTMFAYHDTPSNNVSSNPLGPGDDDVDDIQMPGEKVVTLDFSIRSANPDFLFWVIAVQLTNPFDEPVSIGKYVGDPSDPADRDALYYLELNGEHFPLAGVPLDCYSYVQADNCLGNPGQRNGDPPGGGGGGGAASELWSNPGIVIAPGESKVFIIPSQPLWFIEDRLEHRLGNYDPGDKEISQIREILKAQFGVPPPTADADDRRLGTDESNIVILDKVQGLFDMTLAPFPEGQYAGAQTDTTLLPFEQLMAAPPGQVAGSEIPYELRLWRVMRQNSIKINQDPPDTTLTPIHEFGTGDASNLLENDLLADRMRINVYQRPGGGGIGGGGGQPWFAVLDRRLNDPITPGFEKINNAFTGFGEDDGGIQSLETFDGLAMVSYATVSRPQDEADVANGILAQRVPWYALEAKNRWRDWNGGVLPWNTTDFEADDTNLNGRHTGWKGFPDVDDVLDLEPHMYDPDGDYSGSGNDQKTLAFVRRFDRTLNRRCRTGFETLVRILGNDHNESGNADACANVNNPGDIDAYRATTTGLPILEKDDSGRDLASVDATNLNILGGISVDELALELTRNLDRNTLRPADLLLPLGVGAVYDPDLANNGANPQWTTLSEMLARVLGFDEVNDLDANGLIDDDLYAGVGALRTQDQVAANGAVNEWLDLVVNPADPRIGRAALDKGQIVLDDFVPFLDFNPATPAVERFDPLKGDIPFGMRLPPAIVLLEHVRTLFGDPAVGDRALEHPVPGAVNINTASRTVLRSLPMLSPSRFDWWGNGFDHNRSSDIASTVQAYRDKIAVLFRNVGGGIGGGSGSLIDFADFNADPYDDPNDPNIEQRFNTPRRNATIISALPEERGIRSIGELALMRTLGKPDGIGRVQADLDQIRVHNIDRLGYNANSFGAVEGVESARYARQVGTVRNENVPRGTIIADLGLDDRDDIYKNWTLTFIATSDPDLLGKSFVVSGYIGSDLAQRKAREISYPSPPGNPPLPLPSNGDVFVLSQSAQGTVQIFDPDTDPSSFIATGNFAPGNDYAGSEIIFYGSSSISGQSFIVDSTQFFADGRVEFTLQSAIPLGPGFVGDVRPIVGNSFVLRPPTYGQDLDGQDIAGDPILEDDRINDEFDERLAILDSVINTASVRSDLYAVWFIVQGYQRTDVSGLGPDDPMLPTIRRRFVMVVDRAGVVKQGDKPKILLFKEVPL